MAQSENQIKDEYIQLFKKFAQNDAAVITGTQIYRALVEIGVILDAKAVYDVLRLICEVDGESVDLQQFKRVMHVCANTQLGDIPGMLFYASDEAGSGSISVAALRAVLSRMNIYIAEEQMSGLLPFIAEDELVSYQMFCYLMDEIMNQ